MQIDQTFLKLHPATAEWWQQREQCRQCRGAEITPDVASAGSSATVMRCGFAWVRAGGGGGGKNVRPYCIDARSEGGACGPKATKFKAKNGAKT